MSPTTQKALASVATSAIVYVSIFGIPFQGTINLYVYNRQLLKQQKMAQKHAERMAEIQNTITVK